MTLHCTTTLSSVSYFPTSLLPDSERGIFYILDFTLGGLPGLDLINKQQPEGNFIVEEFLVDDASSLLRTYPSFSCLRICSPLSKSSLLRVPWPTVVAAWTLLLSVPLE
jgi:hypothetical protein